MNKLILISLVIFFAICSKSWAEEEIWDCEIYMGKFHKGTRTYKIDAHIHGDIYIRLDAMWKSFRNKKGNDEVASMFLDEVNENIRVNYKYPGLHEVESTGWTHNVPKYEIYDLVLKTIRAFELDGSELFNAKCKSR